MSCDLAKRIVRISLFAAVASLLAIVQADHARPLFRTSYEPLSHHLDLTVRTNAENLHESSGVFGVDDRIQIKATKTAPSAAMVYLLIEFPNGDVSSCTGFLIGRRTVATAGHCVYDIDNDQWAESTIAIPAANGKLMPFGAVRAKTEHTVRGWGQQHDARYDFGAYNLERDIAVEAGLLPMTADDDGGLQASRLTVSGYPGDKAPATLWQATGRALYSDSFNIYHQIDMTHGDSGGPMWKETTDGFRAVGISSHVVYRTSTGVDIVNVSIRLTAGVISTFNSWMNAAGSTGPAAPQATATAAPAPVPTVQPGQLVSVNPPSLTVRAGRPTYAVVTIFGRRGGGNLVVNTSEGVLVANALLTPASCRTKCVDVDGDSTSTVLIPAIGNDLSLVTLTLAVSSATSPTLVITETQSGGGWQQPVPIVGGGSGAGANTPPAPPAKPKDVFADGRYTAAEIVPGLYTHTGGGPDCIVYRNGVVVPATSYSAGRDGYGFLVRLPQYTIRIDASWTTFASSQCGTWRISE